MEVIKEVFAYLSVHGPAIVTIILSLVGIAEAIVRLTPTKRDDGFVERVGKKVRAFFDMVDKVFPNFRKGGGRHDRGGQHLDVKDKNKIEKDLRLDDLTKKE